MRYSCPSCKRVFYLETKTQSPCPACGTMLQGEDAAGPQATPAAAKQETAATKAAEDIWSAAAQAAPQTQEADIWSAAEQPQAAQEPTEAIPAPRPSASSWFQAEAAQAPAAPAGASYILKEKTSARLTGVPGLGPATGAAEVAEPEPAEGARLTQTGPLLAVGKAPSGAKLFIITGTAMIVTAAAAVLLVMIFKPKFASAPSAPVSQSAQVSALEQDISKLRKELSAKKDELDKLRSTAAEERRAQDARIEELQKEVQGFREGFAQRSEAAVLALEAAALLERRADLAEALQKVSSALRADPRFGPAHRLKGRVLAASGRPEEALAAFEEADKVAKAAGAAGDPEALVLAGEVCLTELADRNLAAEYFKSAAELGAGTPVGLAAESRVLFLQGKWNEAAAKAEEAMKAAPTLALAPLVLGEVAFEQALLKPASERRALFAKADEMLALALRLDPGSARGCLVRGRLLLEDSKLIAGPPNFALPRLGRQSQAERMLSRAMDLSPNWPDVHLALAELRLSDGALRDPAIAVARAKEAVTLTKSKSAVAFATLAAAHAASGNPTNAVQSIKEALKLDPGNQEYRDALRRYESDARAVR